MRERKEWPLPSGKSSEEYIAGLQGIRKSTKQEPETILSFDPANYENILNFSQIDSRLYARHTFQLFNRKLFHCTNDHSRRKYSAGARCRDFHSGLDFRSL